MALNENQKEVVRLTQEYSREFSYINGALCHIVSEDFNMDDDSVDYCLNEVTQARHGLESYWNHLTGQWDYRKALIPYSTAELNTMETYLLALKAIPEEDRETHGWEEDGTEDTELLAALYGR